VAELLSTATRQKLLEYFARATLRKKRLEKDGYVFEGGLTVPRDRPTEIQ
jgi:hypothetical protein